MREKNIEMRFEAINIVEKTKQKHSFLKKIMYSMIRITNEI